jgi:hypothetical protein
MRDWLSNVRPMSNTRKLCFSARPGVIIRQICVVAGCVEERYRALILAAQASSILPRNGSQEVKHIVQEECWSA